MTAKFSLKYFKNFFVLLPFILVYLGSIYSVLDKGFSTKLKIVAFFYMIFYVIIKQKFNTNLLLLTTAFLIQLIYGVLHSWSLEAGISDGIRYLFPIVVLFYGYSIKAHFKLLLKFVIVFVVLNFLVQITNYLGWLRGIDQWFYYKTQTGYIYYAKAAGIIRATGFVVFFSFYGFFNLIAFFLIFKFYFGKFKNILLALTIFSLLASLSFKTIGTIAIVLVIYFYKKIYKIAIYLFLLFVGVYATFPSKINTVTKEFFTRIRVYITEGKSVRAESYRAMFNEIINLNIFGKGVGTFGGPASTTFNSPYYKKINFNWYDTHWLNLSTTDTYPPHLFVELGVFGAFLYLFLLSIPLFRKKANHYYVVNLVIYFALFFDMLFSFSLNNLEYLLFSLIFVYPIFEYGKTQTKN